MFTFYTFLIDVVNTQWHVSLQRTFGKEKNLKTPFLSKQTIAFSPPVWWNFCFLWMYFQYSVSIQ